MPDNAPAPGNAAASGGSQPAGSVAPATSAGGAATPPVSDQMPAWAQALLGEVKATRQQMENQRSLHDRQMGEILRTARSGRAAAVDPAAEAANPDPSARGGNGHRPALPAHVEEQMALIEFRQLNPDWQEYWGDMSQILNDRAKAEGYIIPRVLEDGSVGVDYARTLAAIKQTIENARLRSRSQEFDQSRANSNANREAARRDATISGAGASAPERTLQDVMAQVANLTGDEKVRKLYELAPELFDPNDLPKALRSK